MQRAQRMAEIDLKLGLKAAHSYSAAIYSGRLPMSVIPLNILLSNALVKHCGIMSDPLTNQALQELCIGQTVEEAAKRIEERWGSIATKFDITLSNNLGTQLLDKALDQLKKSPNAKAYIGGIELAAPAASVRDAL